MLSPAQVSEDCGAGNIILPLTFSVWITSCLRFPPHRTSTSAVALCGGDGGVVLLFYRLNVPARRIARSHVWQRCAASDTSSGPADATWSAGAADCDRYGTHESYGEYSADELRA